MELKKTMDKMKNAIEDINRRLDQAEERIYELKERSFVTIQLRVWGENEKEGRKPM